jgi:hypothetical protein
MERTLNDIDVAIDYPGMEPPIRQHFGPRPIQKRGKNLDYYTTRRGCAEGPPTQLVGLNGQLRPQRSFVFVIVFGA